MKLRLKINLYYFCVLIAIAAFIFGKISLNSLILWIVLPPLVSLCVVALMMGLAHKADKLEKEHKEFNDE